MGATFADAVVDALDLQAAQWLLSRLMVKRGIKIWVIFNFSISRCSWFCPIYFTQRGLPFILEAKACSHHPHLYFCETLIVLFLPLDSPKMVFTMNLVYILSMDGDEVCRLLDSPFPSHAQSAVFCHTTLQVLVFEREFSIPIPLF